MIESVDIFAEVIPEDKYRIVDTLQKGGHIVGMTGMPEVALARETGLCYAACAVCANRAAGRGEGAIDMSEIEATLHSSMAQVRTLLEHTINPA